MSLVLRVDLDYVPWDTPDAAEFGHGEPAMFLRLMELTRAKGVRLHLFMSHRTVRAFPSALETALSEGHDVDWLCKHPGDSERAARSLEIFAKYDHVPVGLAVREEWPEGLPLDLQWRFVSATAAPAEMGAKHFPVVTRPVRDAARGGTSVRGWTDGIKTQIREAASRTRPVTAVLRPQALARYDPRLGHLQEILDFADGVGMAISTLRTEVGLSPVAKVPSPTPPRSPASR